MKDWLHAHSHQGYCTQGGSIKGRWNTPCGDQCNLREQFLNFSPLLNAETGTGAATERP
ncbi:MULTISPECIES: hypothetical protein [unclassified Pedobacter]|uniref:hypothetical protein n=1 Tax=unclassified Pedobacter TaxID=2628915 RepID=UPI0014239BDA|nr:MULTISPECIES: hypothetical protein [unclassified Pedobacter]NII84023.1 hypothetical protein [Pedobacter sp. SG908]NMN37897.1 hypothetical protein [Pedobacter sp. SG918]